MLQKSLTTTILGKNKGNTKGWNTKQAKRIENTTFSEGLIDKYDKRNR